VPTLTIDGIEVEVEEGAMVLSAIRSLGMEIPTLCHQDGLSPYGACRLCIVEIEGMRGFPASCSTPAKDGMVVRTNTPRVQQLRRSVLELILSEHPSGCLLCERKQECEEFRGHAGKSGLVTGCMFCPKKDDCELRELVEKVGLSEIRFEPIHKSLPVERLDPFFDRDYNLCVLCGRCVRVCQEVRGAGTISLINRGHETRVSTAFHALHLDMSCQFCGACVDVCPTGALSDRTSKWEPKPEKMVRSTCSLCPVGCGIQVGVAQGRVVKSLAAEDDSVGAGQLCALGRFAIQELTNTRERVSVPLVRRFDNLLKSSWDEAIALAAEGLAKFKPSERALMFPRSVTLEEALAFSRFADQALETQNVSSLSPPQKWELFDASLTSLEAGDCVLLLGADLMQTHPILGLNVKRATERGARLVIADTVSTFLDKFASAKIATRPGGYVSAVAGLVKALLETSDKQRYEELEGFNEFAGWASQISFDDVGSAASADAGCLKKAAEMLSSSSNALVIVGPEVGSDATSEPFTTGVNDLRLLLGAEGRQCEVASLDTRGDFDADWLKTVQDIQSGRVKALVMVGDLVPELGPEVKNPLDRLDFLVVIDSHRGSYAPHADVVLPSAFVTEMGGTYTAVDGSKREIKPAVRPLGHAKPGWVVASLLAKALGTDLGWEDLESIRRGLDADRREGADLGERRPAVLAPFELCAVARPSSEWPLVLVNRHNSHLYNGHRIGGLVPGIGALDDGCLRICGETLVELGLKDRDEIEIVAEHGQVVAEVRADATVPKGLAVSRWSANDPRLLGLLGVEAVCLGHNSVAVRIEGIRRDSDV